MRCSSQWLLGGQGINRAGGQLPMLTHLCHPVRGWEQTCVGGSVPVVVLICIGCGELCG